MSVVAAPGGMQKLLGEAPPQEPAWRRSERSAAQEWLERHGLPGRRDELWHYVPTRRVHEALTGAALPPQPQFLDPRQVDIMAGDLGGSRLVFVNGAYDSGASRTAPAQGVSVGTVGTVDSLEGPDPSPVGSAPRLDGVVALNLAAARWGARIRVSAGVDDALVHVVHVAVPGPDETFATFPSTLIELDEHSRATVVETFVGFPGSVVVDAVTRIDLASWARLSYRRIQTQRSSTIHLGSVSARLGGGARLESTSVSLGADLSREAFDVTLAGDDSSVALDGLYLPGDGQHLDHTLTVQHSANRTTSGQRFKGVIDHGGRGSFTGHVIVDPDIVGTTAHQANHNILLSAQSEADTRPWLEILADDVRCTHGATVGRLDDEALFYMRSRGIPEPTAREMLIEGFAQEIVEAIEPEALRDHLTAGITASRRRAAGAGRAER